MPSSPDSPTDARHRHELPAVRFAPSRTIASLYAGVGGGTVVVVAEILLWWAFTDALPGILYRDAHMAAALVLGPSMLVSPEHLEPLAITVATVVHFALSFVYALVLSWLVPRNAVAALLVGAAFGTLVFVVNMYGFTDAFPWFVVTRDPITFSAHIVFGASTAIFLRSQRLDLPGKRWRHP